MKDLEHDWITLRAKAVAAFADAPSGQLEQQLVDAYYEDPDRITKLINRIIKANDNKPFDSPWAVIRSNLEPPTINPTITANVSRQRLIDQAKTWIANAGHYHHTWPDCAAELFGDGALTPPLDYLTTLEQQTRDNPGRRIYNRLLLAAIEHTKSHGREPTPDDPSAQLYTLRKDDDARAELHAEWLAHRVRTLKAEADHEAWNAKAKADRALILSLASHPTSEDIDFTP